MPPVQPPGTFYAETEADKMATLDRRSEGYDIVGEGDKPE